VTTRFSERTGWWLLGAAALVLAIFAGGVAWARTREIALAARYSRQIDSLTTVAAQARASADSAAVRYHVDTVHIRTTTIKYRDAVQQLAAPVQTASGDTVRPDTLPQVVAVVTACQATIAARDTALGTCEARVAALRRLFAADSGRQATVTAQLRHVAAIERRKASRRSLLRGIVLGIVGAVVVHQTVTR